MLPKTPVQIAKERRDNAKKELILAQEAYEQILEKAQQRDIKAGFQVHHTDVQDPWKNIPD